MMVSHSGERHRSVKRHPFAWKDPIKKIVQFFADQETQAGSQISHLKEKNGILLPKLFCTVRKNCSSDQEKLLKFKAEGREFTKIVRSLEKFIHTVKGQNNFW